MCLPISLTLCPLIPTDYSPTCFAGIMLLTTRAELYGGTIFLFCSPSWDDLSQSKLAFSNLKILPVLFLNYVGTIACYQDKPTLKAIFLSPGYFYTLYWNTRTGLTLSSVNSAYVLLSALQYEVNKLNQSCHWQWSSSCEILTKKSGTITTFIILLTNFNWFVRKLFSFVISLNQYDLCTIFCLVESW